MHPESCLRFSISNWPLYGWQLRQHLPCDGNSGVPDDGGSGIAVTAVTTQTQSKEDDRVANSGTVMREVLQLRSDIPASLLQKAEGVIVVPC